MKTTATILLSLGLLGGIAASGQIFDTNNWEGNKWSYNVNQGSWFPNVASGVASFAIDDYSWGQIHSTTNYQGSVRTTFFLKPELQSGGVNEDAAYFAFGNDWVYYAVNPIGQLLPYNPPPAAGIQFFNGTVAIGDHRSGFTPIGNYTPGVWVQITMDYSPSGLLQAMGPGFTGSYQSTNMFTNGFKFIIGMANATDGIQISNVNTIVTSTNVAFASENWVGKKWTGNIDQGSWLPSFSDNMATFATDDYSWGQIRSVDSQPGSIRATFEINAALDSGGVNSDEAFFGFGNLWVKYGGEPTTGIRLSDGNVYLWDSLAGGEGQQIGTYTPGTWVPLTLDLNARGMLRVSGPGISGSRQLTNILASYNFIIAEKDSSSGFQVRNVALGQSANILNTVEGAMYYGLQIKDGIPSQQYTIYATTNLLAPVWTPLTTFTQSQSGFLWVDTNSPASGPQKFYKVAP